jgi:hypothetical protein
MDRPTMDDVTGLLVLSALLTGMLIGYWLRVEGRDILAHLIDRLEDVSGR